MVAVDRNFNMRVKLLLGEGKTQDLAEVGVGRLPVQYIM